MQIFPNAPATDLTLVTSQIKEKPLITVITVVFNGEKYLENSLKSVIFQDYDNIEYIIIDGIRKLVMSELWATTRLGAKRRLKSLLDKNDQ